MTLDLAFSEYTALLHAGVRAPLIMALMKDHAIGADDIAVRDGRWERRFQGERAILLDADGDTVAFRLQAPRAFWRAHGSALLLGRDALERAAFLGTPLWVYETPLDWLRADCDGVVILDWVHYWPIYLGGLATLRTKDVAFGQRLRAMLEHPLPRPEIQVAA